MTEENALKDYTKTELTIVSDSLLERFGHAVDVVQADVEIRLNPDDRELVSRPALYWESPGDKSKFIIIKLGDGEYKSQFFYRGYQQYGTGVDKYDNIGDCVVDMLQVNEQFNVPGSVLDRRRHK